ncbi:FAD-binding oxidoreductase [Photobacterium gaetbulicola]|uniref:Putative oxidoreductase, oxygen dependent, FAD-dependent protein n=1 Tax=Photobacterium gaetbulicola Gung47 TaxID=658445 RepID=A0A0C5WK95_9GAMM|nr:FAD-binding oxidoreductase [Photobacterium gaetbulicola]AJR05544.1 putative oxidoreductase, oxygen dependent, FAD-dependent protein [Photobacterium gaetbulicola Gung47]PSU14531.1 FAD-binding oxidoreductase [Photobacterium gaetbulicola]
MSSHQANLTSQIQGRVIVPGDAEYDEARQIWNAMIDKRPAVIVKCTNTSDVLAALNYAKAQKLEITIRGAGHNIAGNAICDDGLMIDLSDMKKVTVDPGAKRVLVQPGATLADIDAATQQHGLATPVGINSTTGISGLTLGGGFGWLTRKFGMTIDNLVSAQVVTADGRQLTASSTENSELFWAIRGGGGNFGIVTEFEFQLHSVGPEILAGLIVYPFDQAKQVLEQYRTFTQTAPADLNVWVVMRQAPPLPFLPEEVHGKEVIVLAIFYAGDLQQGETLIEPLRQFGTPHGEHIGAQPYTAWQQAFDPLLTEGMRNYWKSHNFTELHDDALDLLLHYAGNLPSPHCEIFIGQLAGSANTVASDAMAYSSRDAKFVLNVHARWETPAEDEDAINWARDFFKATTPFASAGAYVNFMTAEEGGRVTAAYDSNYQRLVEIKRQYDPDNLFHHNQNIKP